MTDTAALSARIATLQESLNTTCILITSPAMVEYFTGIPELLPKEREAVLAISKKQAWLFHSAFITPPKVAAIAHIPDHRIDTVARTLSSECADTPLQFETTDLTVFEYNHLEAHNLKLEPLSPAFLWKMRMRKDAQEQSFITQAAKVTRQVLADHLESLSVGQTEQEIQESIDAAFRKLNAEPAFPTIVAFGPHTASPHHQPTSTPLTNNTTVLIDCGARVHRYAADMTRTIWFGNAPSNIFTTIETAVHAAYKIGQKKLTPDFTAGDVDETVRSSLKEQGFEKEFMHTSGHGIGLEVHEPPSLFGTQTTQLNSGMCVTLEPGVYLQGECGYRHEDTYILTSEKPKNLTQF